MWDHRVKLTGLAPISQLPGPDALHDHRCFVVAGQVRVVLHRCSAEVQDHIMGIPHEALEV
jgi:hypothetical protein